MLEQLQGVADGLRSEGIDTNVVELVDEYGKIINEQLAKVALHSNDADAGVLLDLVGRLKTCNQAPRLVAAIPADETRDLR